MAQPPPGHYPVYPPVPTLNPVPVPVYSHPMPWPMPMPPPMPPSAAPPPMYIGAPANPVSSKRRRDDGGAAAEDELSAAKRRAVAQDVIFRIVVPYRQIGKVIGKEGCRIQKIREETKATVKIADAIVRHEERVIIISSKENDNNVTDAEKALQKIATLILKGVEGLIGGGPPFR